MLRKRRLLCVLGATALLAGCAMYSRQPQLQNAAITPAILKPGDSAVVTVEVADRYDIVERVIGIVPEEPWVKFHLQDNGEPPDVAAGDGVWSLLVDVPFQAPPGEFTLELTAYNSKGDVVLVRNTEGDTVPLSTSCSVLIAYPEQ